MIKDAERLLGQIAQQTIVVENPHKFDFAKLNDALQFSKIEKQKAVVEVIK
ncbi:hypothetical protein Q4574_18840 [Aliiglaciecola sp. 3_MG-2023]|uniref:hypothetical protein n=1 Tax=Aliiglaciecola sp. 3_MG-2023 TaxID=3062644 RepID=UPI0026E12EAA|nr:hypothetical protein [Aliiglaciecola sp. 3_MG-2023]MDO6695362.1 hypothetical protein [Aliiglaciecola sp. 3_MG-2023]